MRTFDIFDVWSVPMSLLSEGSPSAAMPFGSNSGDVSFHPGGQSVYSGNTLSIDPMDYSAFSQHIQAPTTAQNVSVATADQPYPYFDSLNFAAIGIPPGQVVNQASWPTATSEGAAVNSISHPVSHLLNVGSHLSSAGLSLVDDMSFDNGDAIDQYYGATGEVSLNSSYFNANLSSGYGAIPDQQNLMECLPIRLQEDEVPRISMTRFEGDDSRLVTGVGLRQTQELHNPALSISGGSSTSQINFGSLNPIERDFSEDAYSGSVYPNCPDWMADSAPPHRFNQPSIYDFWNGTASNLDYGGLIPRQGPVSDASTTSYTGNDASLDSERRSFFV